MNEAYIKSLEMAVSQAPTNVTLKKLLADAYFNLAKYEDAESAYKSIIALDATDSEAKLQLAHCFYKTQKLTAAQVVLEELIDQNPTAAPAYLLLAKTQLELNEIKAAKQTYSKINAIDPFFFDKEFEEKLNQELKKSGQALSNSVEDDFFNSLIEESDLERPEISFKDVGGMEKIKEEISLKVIHPLKHPEIYAAYGKKIGGGILLYGPPGCGKTMLARATAGEINSNFISVGINEVLDMWIGSSEKNLHDLFEQARMSAPCVLFFDEVDALGASRNDMRKAAGRFLINQFLDEMDGVKYSNEGILILAATNCPWYLDAAFRRPGRFDRVVFVQPPDIKAREEIFKLQLQNKPHEGLDFATLAKQTEEYSGADIKAVVDLAVEQKLPESLKQGKVLAITSQDFKGALAKHKPTTKEWFATAKNYALYSNENGLYDDILHYLKIKK